MTQPGQQVGSPCTTCVASQPQPTPPTDQPCDFDAVQLVCKHCGSDKREIPSFEFKLEGRSIRHNLRRSPNRRRPLIDSTFDVIHDDEVTVKIIGGPGPCGSHHLLVISPHGQPVERYVGKREHKFKALYPNDWFERNIAAASGRPFLQALRAFFYPAPVSYPVEVIACGKREGGNFFRSAAAFGVYAKRVDVYPNDIFGIKLAIPSFKKVTREGSDRVTAFGDRQIVQTSGRSTVHGLSGQSHSVEEETSFGSRPTTIERTETVRDRQGRVEEVQRLTELPDGGTAHESRIEGGAGTAHPLRRPGVLTISRNQGDITNRFQLVAWIDGILTFLRMMESLIDTLKQLRSAAQIGWAFSLELEFLAGELSVEWGWKEWKKDHQIYRYWKVGASLTLFDATLEVSFGLKILKAEACIFGAISGSLKIETDREANPDDARTPQEVTATGSVGGELGVRGSLGDWVKVEGKITAGIEGESKFTFAPFKWSLRAYRAKGEGTFTVKCKYWWDHTRKTTLWSRAPLGPEKVLIG